ncbi:MAG TPA: DUF4389 domain-containing protein [Acidimicrobiales bacterium]|nr:DUF4389 domain-containing protein [Acidimicrobiales bacterium]
MTSIETTAAAAPPQGPAEGSAPVALTFGPSQRQKRVTVVFRLILVIPQLVALYFLALAAVVLVVVAWFAALVTGRVPGGIAEFLIGWLAGRRGCRPTSSA